MQRIGLSIVAAIFLIGLAVCANAQMGDCKGKGGAMSMGMGGGMGMWDGAHGRHFISLLDLDENQTAQVKPILYKLQKDMIKRRADIKVAKIDLEEILDKDPVDVKAAEAKIRQIASSEAEAAVIHLQGIEDLKAKLNPEQKKKLTGMMQMKGTGHGMMNCPMMEGKTPMGPHHPNPGNAAPMKGKADRTITPQ